MSAYYIASLAAGLTFAGSVLLAWVTGDVRKYGHNLERLIDLVAKMPPGESRDRMEVAVEEEAARLVKKPPRIRRATRIVVVLGLPVLIPLQIAWWLHKGWTRQEAGLGVWFYLFLYLAALLLSALGEIGDFYLKSWSWPQRLPRKIRPHQRFTTKPSATISGSHRASVDGKPEQVESGDTSEEGPARH